MNTQLLAILVGILMLGMTMSVSGKRTVDQYLLAAIFWVVLALNFK